MAECGLQVTGQATYDLVENQVNQFTQKGNIAFSTALEALQAISRSFQGSVSSNGVSNIGSFPLDDSAPLPTYTPPTPVPTEPDIHFVKPDSIVDPPDDDLDLDGAFAGLKSPVNLAIVPTLQLPSPPATSLPKAPDSPEPLVVPLYPVSPSITEPSLPHLRQIQMPILDVPDLSKIDALIIELRNSVPESPEIPPDIDFIDLVSQLFASSKTEVADILSSLVGRIETLLAGGSGLDAGTAEALRNRAFGAEDRQAFQAESTILGDWLSRGFTLPGGALAAQVNEVLQKNRDKKSELNRDIWIEEAKFEIENLRFAVQQGIAYEGMWKDSLIKLYGICGQLAEKAADVQLNLLSAAIELYKAQSQMWQIQFSTIKDQLQIELSKLEIYKSELDAQKLIGQLNQQDVELYKTQLDALNTRISIYKTEVDAANSKLQAELGKLEYAAKRIQIYTAEIGAWEAEWRGYTAAISGETAKVDLYRGMVQGFSAEVQAYATNVDAAKSKASLQLETLNSKIKAWEGTVEKYKAELQGEVARVGSLSQVYDSTVRAYGVKAGVEETYIKTELGKLDYLLNVDRFNSDVTIKEAELDQQKLLQLTKITQDALDAVARTSAQLAGSAMSAMNVGASISSGASLSQSASCSESYSYSA